MKRRALLAYIAIIFLLELPAVFLTAKTALNYVSLEVFAMGILAILFQKKVNRGKFLDMGFRINRNTFIGIAIAILFIGIALLFNGFVPYWFGWAEVLRNPESAVPTTDIPPIVIAATILVVGGIILFIPCIFGEELAFRGYILPKLQEQFGGVKATLLCSLIFGLWHLPAYFSIYSGGAADEGFVSVLLMLLAHGISVVPLCVLYLTTRELYGVSVYHAVVDVIQYCIVADTSFGEASKNALYNLYIRNELAAEVVGWLWLVTAIPLMVVVCRFARRWALTTDCTCLARAPALTTQVSPDVRSNEL